MSPQPCMEDAGYINHVCMCVHIPTPHIREQIENIYDVGRLKSLTVTSGTCAADALFSTNEGPEPITSLWMLAS